MIKRLEATALSRVEASLLYFQHIFDSIEKRVLRICSG